MLKLRLWLRDERNKYSGCRLLLSSKFRYVEVLEPRPPTFFGPTIYLSLFQIVSH